MNAWRIRFLRLVLLLAGLLLLTVSVTAAFEMTPSISVRQEYNDNIFFDDDEETDDFITTVRPGLALSHRTQRLDLNLSGEIAPFFYRDNDDLNDIDQTYQGRIRHQMTERLSARLEGSFAIDNRPDRDIIDSGLIQQSEARRRQRYGTGLNYTLTEKAAVGTSYTFRHEEFTANKQPDDEDWKSHAFDVGYSYNLAKWIPNTTGRLGAGFTRYDFESSDTDYYFGSAGFEYQISELFSFTMDLGARYTSSDFDVQQLALVPPGVLQVVTKTENDSGLGGIGMAGLMYRGEKTRWNINASHDIDAASGRGGVVQRSRCFLNANHLLSEKLRLGIYSGVYYNKSDNDEFSTEEIDEFVYSIRPSLRWEFWRNFTVETAYNFTYVDDGTEGGGDAQQHLVFLQIAYGLPLFDAFKGVSWSSGYTRAESSPAQY